MRKLRELYPNTIKLAFPILWMYLFVVFSMHVIAQNASYSVPFAVFACLISFVLTYFIFYFSGAVICKFNTPTREWSKKSLLIASGVIWIITFLFFYGYFLCQYPGGSSPDVKSQYTQALSGIYSNWHPVLHTLLFFTLPIKLTNIGFPLIVFLQILYFSIAFAYLMCVLLKNGIKSAFAVLICVFVWINPYLATYLMYPWKDLGFMIFAIVLIAQYIQIVCSGGAWLKKKLNLTAFSIVSVLCMYMRHNALLFVIPIVVFSFIYARKSKRVIMGIIAIMAICILSIQVLYAVLNVEKPDKRTLETVGLPATIWCSVMQKTPNALPEETREVMYKIATQEQYNYTYTDGEFNSIKWYGANTAVIDEMSYLEVIKYTAQCFIYSPRASLEGLSKLTYMVWGLEENKNTFIVYCAVDQVLIGTSPNAKLAEYFNQYIRFFSNSGFLKTLFGSYGLQIMVLLAVGMVLLAKKRVSIIHAIPLFCYNFGTMLLLSGSDYRFFIYNMPIWLAVLFLMLKDKTELKTKNHKKEKVEMLPS